MITGLLEPETDESPWWARVGIWFLTHYGMPTVIACGLGALFIWLAIGDVKAIRVDVSETRKGVTTALDSLQTHNQQMLSDAARAHELHETEIRILQAMCYNAAKSDAGRYACAGGK